jgi:hypothetical protein
MTAMAEPPAPLTAWHAVVAAQNPALLDALLDENVEFRSPAVFTPQRGKALTTAYLTAALELLGPTLRYVHQWHDTGSAVLEFEAEVGGRLVHGVDMLRWNDAGLLTGVTVMMRPLSALQQVVPRMAELLAAGSRPQAG